MCQKRSCTAILAVFKIDIRRSRYRRIQPSPKPKSNKQIEERAAYRQIWARLGQTEMAGRRTAKVRRRLRQVSQLTRCPSASAPDPSQHSTGNAARSETASIGASLPLLEGSESGCKTDVRFRRDRSLWQSKKSLNVNLIVRLGMKREIALADEKREPAIGFDRFIVCAPTPFRPENCEELIEDAPSVRGGAVFSRVPEALCTQGLDHVPVN